MAALDSQETVPAPFITKTYQFVDDPNTDHIVSWGEDGSTFVIRRPVDFAHYLLPNYFKHDNFSSFIRQLLTYGFRKISDERWEFANEYFKKGEKHLLCEIRRRKTIQPKVELNHHHQSFSPYRHSARDSTSPPDSDHEHQLNNNWSTTVPDVYHLRPSRSGTEESSISSGPEVSDAVPPLYFMNPTKEVKSNATPEVSDTVEVMNISPELETEFPPEVSTDSILNAEFDHEFDGDSTQYQKRAGSTRYRSIQSLVDRFLEENINTIGDDQVKLDQYGMPRLRDFITLKFFQMAKESGLMLVMDSTNTSNMLKHFEEPLLRDCIQEIQKGPIQTDLFKTFAQPYSVDEKLDRIKRWRMKMSLDGAKQGAAVVVGHVLSSSRSGVVIYVMIFALFMGISFSMLAHLLRKHKSVSKVLTKLGIMGTASSVILSFAALIPKVIISCTFGTIAILLLAFMLMKN